MIIKFFNVFLLVLFFSNLAYANPTRNESKYKMDIANEDRIYLNRTNIFFSDQGVFFALEQDLIPLSSLHMERNEYYVARDEYIKILSKLEQLKLRAIWGETWICPKRACRYENYEGIDYCGMCGAYRYDRTERTNFSVN